MTWTKISQVTDYLRWTKKNMSPALQQGVREWAEEELPKRFEHGNTGKYNYVPNTFKYEDQKFRKYGKPLPQLVSEGTLRDSVVSNFKVSTYSFTLRYPEYGKYQRLNGRDFTQLRELDLQTISKNFATVMKLWMKNRK